MRELKCIKGKVSIDHNRKYENLTVVSELLQKIRNINRKTSPKKRKKITWKYYLI